ncbi:MAG: DUF4388 domain-containing protein [Cyanobacteriota bacterium]|nr:DUF4388 domain-containing protein [Cyanobacteriota bacterium]
MIAKVDLKGDGIMAMVGDLKDLALPELLQMLGRGKKTGQLAIWSPNGIHRIWFYQGRIVAALTPDETSSLSKILANHQGVQTCSGMISSRLLAKFSTLCCPVNEPLGVCVKKQGLVDPLLLAQAFRQQLQAGLLILFGLESGQFSFAADVPLPYGEMTGLTKAASEVALEGLRYQQKLLESSDQNLPQPDSSLRRVIQGLPTFKLSPEEWSLWENAAPAQKVTTLSQSLEMDLLSTRKLAARLIRIGLLAEVPATGEMVPEKVSGSSKIPSSLPARASDAPSLSLLNRLATVLKYVRASQATASSVRPQF